jgi:hypothetical protein
MQLDLYEKKDFLLSLFFNAQRMSNNAMMKSMKFQELLKVSRQNI